MGLLGRVGTLKEEQTGLLRKSLKSLGRTAGTEEKPADRHLDARSSQRLKPDAPAILSRIAGLAHGIDAPAFLFQLIQEYVGFNHGILLLAAEQTHTWICLASSGLKWKSEIPFARVDDLLSELDTQSRRRIDSSRLPNFILDGEEQRIESAVLKAFYHEERLIGLLILDDAYGDALDKIKTVVTSHAHRIVRTQYDYLSSHIEQTLGAHSLLLKELTGRGSESRQPIIVDFGAVIRIISSEVECICLSWLHRILSYLLAGLCEGIGITYEGTNDHMILLLPPEVRLEEQLAAHQSALSMQSHFRALINPEHIQFRTVSVEDILLSGK